VWVGIFTNANAQVVRVDPETNEVVDRIDLESDYVRQVVAIDGAVMVNELVWSGNEGPCGILTTIDPTDGTVVVREPIEPGCGGAKLMVWDGRIWAVLGEQFRPLDPMTSRPDGVGFNFAPQHSPRGFILADTTGIWYAAYPGGNGNGPDTLTRMNPADGHLDEYITLDHGGRAAVVLDGSLWTLGFEGTLTRIDLESESGESGYAQVPTAQSIMQNGGPVGTELAAALGLKLEDGFDQVCAYYVEVEESGAGYCLVGISTDTADLYVIAEALRGRILTPEELQEFRDANEAAGGTQFISGSPSPG
jgi:hypothetical protein